MNKKDYNGGTVLLIYDSRARHNEINIITEGRFFCYIETNKQELNR